MKEETKNKDVDYQTYFYYLEDFVQEVFDRLKERKKNLKSEFDHGIAFGLEECLSIIKFDKEVWNLQIKNLEKIKDEIRL